MISKSFDPGECSPGLFLIRANVDSAQERAAQMLPESVCRMGQSQAGDQIDRPKEAEKKKNAHTQQLRKRNIWRCEAERKKQQEEDAHEDERTRCHFHGHCDF